MRYLVTRNRRDKPFTPYLDEFIDGKATGRIVISYYIKDGKYTPIYQSNNDEIINFDYEKYIKWFNKQFDHKLKRIKINEKSNETIKNKKYYIIEFDWCYGHEKEEFETKKLLKEWFERCKEKFSDFNFENIKIYEEIRYIRK